MAKGSPTNAHRYGADQTRQPPPDDTPPGMEFEALLEFLARHPSLTRRILAQDAGTVLFEVLHKLARVPAVDDPSQVHPPKGKVVKHDTKAGRIDQRFVDEKKSSSPRKGVRREILFPTERSTIGHKRIDQAIERVVSRKK